MAHWQLPAQSGEDFLPIFANGEVDYGGSSDNEGSEKEPGSNLSHSFIPYFVHRTHFLWIGFLVCCFFCMFVFCSSVCAVSSPSSQLDFGGRPA
jgi:hypothetical protein